MMKVDKFFCAFFIFSSIVHIFILTVSFSDQDSEAKEFKELKIKLGNEKVQLNSQEAKAPKASSPFEHAKKEKRSDNFKEENVAKNKKSSSSESIDISELKTDNSNNKSKQIIVSEEDSVADKINENEKKDKILKEKKRIKRVVETASKDIVVPKAKSGETFQEAQPINNYEIGGDGSEVGNSQEEDAQVDLTYSKLLPRWLERFQVYPEQAQLLNLQGRGVIKLTFTRKGKVLKAEIVESTGHNILDSALFSMVERADPVIPVPDGLLPEKDVLTYEMAVSFYPDKKSN
jgi:TonB family protein